MTGMVVEQGYTARSTVASAHGAIAAMAGLVAARRDWHGKALGLAWHGANRHHDESWPLFCDAAISPSDVALG